MQSLWYPERSLSRDTTQRPLPDAELRKLGVNPIAAKIIESSFKHDITQQDAVDTFKEFMRRYTSVSYFVHPEVLPAFEQARAALHQKSQARVSFYGLDAQKIPLVTEQTPSVRGGATQLPPT